MLFIHLCGVCYRNKVWRSAGCGHIQNFIDIIVGIGSSSGTKNTICAQRIIHGTPDWKIIRITIIYTPGKICTYDIRSFGTIAFIVELSHGKHIIVTLNKCGFNLFGSADRQNPSAPCYAANSCKVIPNCTCNSAHMSSMVAKAYISVMAVSIPAIKVIHKTIPVIINTIIRNFTVIFEEVKIVMIQVKAIVNNSHYNGVSCNRGLVNSVIPCLRSINVGIGETTVLTGVMEVPLIRKIEIIRKGLTHLKPSVGLCYFNRTLFTEKKRHTCFRCTGRIKPAQPNIQVFRNTTFKMQILCSIFCFQKIHNLITFSISVIELD